MEDKELIEALIEKCKNLEEIINSKTIWLNSYYVADIKKRQRKFNFPEWISEEDIEYKIIDRKLWKIFILIK